MEAKIELKEEFKGDAFDRLMNVLLDGKYDKCKFDEEFKLIVGKEISVEEFKKKIIEFLKKIVMLRYENNLY